MPDIAIRAIDLSKQYRIGQLHERSDTLRDALMAGPGRMRRNPQSATGNQQYPKGTPSEESIWALKDVSFEVKRGGVVGSAAPREQYKAKAA